MASQASLGLSHRLVGVRILLSSRIGDCWLLVSWAGFLGPDLGCAIVILAFRISLLLMLIEGAL